MTATPVTRTVKLNGRRTVLSAPPGRRLLDLLRLDLGLTGAKEGCGEGECGACTVLLDRDPVASCLVPFGQLRDGAEILTIEGVSRTRLGQTIQKAYADAGAVQCGFCIPGMVVASYALLLRDPSPTEAAIRTAIAGNLCRCTGYKKIVAAIRLAATRNAKQAKPASKSAKKSEHSSKTASISVKKRISSKKSSKN